MAISKLDFARGQVVNPLDSIGDDLLKFGSSLHQQEKDRLETIRQVNADKRAQEQLDMQKQQYADQKEKEAAMQAFAANISKPRQLAESSALFKQVDADKAAFDKRMESVAYTEPENVYTSGTTDQATKDRLVASGLVNPAEVERKTKQQMDLAGMVLAPTDAMKETRTQQIERVMQEMASKGQPITTAVYQELDKARLADETAKTAKEKSLDELIKDSKKERIDMLKYGATALDKSRSGGVTVDDDGTLHYGGAAGTKALTSALDAEKKRIIGYQDATASIPAAINKVTEKNKPTEKVRAAMTKSANELVDALVANKVDPKVAGELVASQLSAGESGYLWGTLFGKDGSVKAINPDTMNSLIASGKKLSEIEQQKALVTAGGSVPKDSMAYELGVGLSRQADADLASLKAKKQVLDMTPEERQYAATKNRLDEILKPTAAEADKEIDVTVSRPGKVGKGFTVDKHVNDQNSDAVAGSVKNIVDIAGNSFNNNGLKVAMGMTANEVMESGLNHKKVTPEETKSRGKFNSLGLYQMNGNHEKAFEKMFNKPILESSPEEQRKYVIDYLSKNPKIQEALSKAETAADAAEIITRTFEKPANIEERVAERRAVAEQVERAFNQSSNVPMEYKRTTRGSTTILPADKVQGKNAVQAKNEIIANLTTGKQWQDDILTDKTRTVTIPTVNVPDQFKNANELTSTLKTISKNSGDLGYQRTLNRALTAFDNAGMTLEDITKLAASADDKDVRELAAAARKYKMSIGTDTERQQIIDEGIERAKYAFLTDLVTSVPGAGILGKVAGKVPVLRNLAGTPGAVAGTYAKPATAASTNPSRFVIRPAPQYPVRNTVLSSPEELAAAEARRRSLFP